MFKELKARLSGKGYEVGNGSPIRKVDVTNGCQYYRVDLRRSPAGKPVRKNFTTAQKACSFASKSMAKSAAAAAKKNTPADAKREAMEILNPFNASISEAAMFYARFHGARDRENSVGFLVARFVAQKEQLAQKGELTPSSLIDIKHFLKRFTREFAPRAVDLVTPGELDHFLDEINGTANRRSHRLYISAFFNWVVAEELLERNPVHKTRRVQARKQSPEIYPPKDVAGIMDAAGDELVPYLALSLFSGASAAEILRIRWHDVDFEKARIQLCGVKEGEERTIRMPKNLVQFLVSHRGTPDELVVPHGQRSLQRWIKKLHEELDIKAIYQGSRHSFATYHLALHPLTETMQELGCSRNSTLFKYYNSASVELYKQASVYFAIMPVDQGSIIPLEQEAA